MRIEKLAEKKYKLVWYVGRQQKTKIIKASYSDAKIIADEISRKLLYQKNGLQLQKKFEGVTLQLLIREFNSRPGIAASTHKTNKQIAESLEEFLPPAWPMWQVSTFELVTLQRKIASQKSNYWANVSMRLIKQAITYATKCERIQEPNIRFPSALAHSAKTKPTITAEEMEVIAEELPTNQAAFMRLMFWLGGPRPSELKALTWDRVDLKKRTVTFLQHKRGKSLSAKPRVVPIIATAEKILKTIPRTSDLVFPVGGFALALKRACTRLKIPPISPYCIRHSVATELPGDLATVQQMLGHSTITLTANVYRHAKVERLRTAMETLADTPEKRRKRWLQLFREKAAQVGSVKAAEWLISELVK